jgi:hypothetical protein
MKYRKKLGYGCREFGTKEIRKAYRQCRKNKKRFGVSFDDSETWNLDHTFMRYCWDNNICRTEFMKWYISGHYWTDDITTETYESGLKETLDSIERLYFSASYYDMVKLTKLCNFLLPRLIRFKQVTMGYPPDMTPEEWDRYIDSTVEEIKQHIFFKFFERFGNFWW